jgi:Major tropism determinant N-terminal domain
MSIQLRRGTEAERALIFPAEGELIYTTDTKLLYVGDGSTLGGNLVTNPGALGGDATGNINLNNHNITGNGGLTINGVSGAITASSFSGNWSGSLSGNVTLGNHLITNNSNLTINGTTGAITAASFTGVISGSLGTNLLTQTYNITNGTNLTINGTTGQISTAGIITSDLQIFANRITCTGADATVRLVTNLGNATDGRVVSIGSNVLPNGLVTWAGRTKSSRVYGTTDGGLNHPYYETRTSRGSMTSPTVVEPYDAVHSMRISVWDGSGGWDTVNALEFYAGGTVGSGTTTGGTQILVKNAIGDFNYFWFDEFGDFLSPNGIRTAALSAEPTTPVAGTYYTADGVTWDPASKSGSVPYPVFYNGVTYNSLY